jgi:hypothetical protein
LVACPGPLFLSSRGSLLHESCHAFWCSLEVSSERPVASSRYGVLSVLLDKLEFKYHGPLTVTRVISDVNYEIEGQLSSRKHFKNVVHIERLKPFYDDARQ